MNNTPLPPIFGMENRSMYTVPVGKAGPGLAALRNRTKMAVKASVTPFKVGASQFPNGKKVKVIKP